MFSGPMALHSQPVSLQGKRLTVAVDSPAWLQQLTYIKPQLLKRLSHYGISDITIRVGRLSLDNQAEPEKRSPDREPAEQEIRLLEQHLKDIHDPELYEAVKGAMMGQLKRMPLQSSPDDDNKLSK